MQPAIEVKYFNTLIILTIDTNLMIDHTHTDNNYTTTPLKGAAYNILSLEVT